VSAALNMSWLYVTHWRHRCRRDDVQRPVRVIHPAAKLKDAANSSVPELSFQRQVVEEYRSRQPQDLVNLTGESTPPAVLNSCGNSRPGISSSDTSSILHTKPPKRNIVVTDNDSDVEVETDNPWKPSKRRTLIFSLLYPPNSLPYL
jgi:hypothetical protein